MIDWNWPVHVFGSWFQNDLSTANVVGMIIGGTIGGIAISVHMIREYYQGREEFADVMFVSFMVTGIGALVGIAWPIFIALIWYGSPIAAAWGIMFWAMKPGRFTGAANRWDRFSHPNNPKELRDEERI